MIAVLDTSAAIEVFLGRPKGRPITNILANSRLVIAPDLFTSEVTNVFYKLYKARELSREVCERGINDCLALVDDLIPMAELAQEVFAASVNFDLSSYDLFYAVISRRYNGTLLTIDKKLKETAKKMKIVTI